MIEESAVGLSTAGKRFLIWIERVKENSRSSRGRAKVETARKGGCPAVLRGRGRPENRGRDRWKREETEAVSTRAWKNRAESRENVENFVEIVEGLKNLPPDLADVKSGKWKNCRRNSAVADILDDVLDRLLVAQVVRHVLFDLLDGIDDRAVVAPAELLADGGH